MAININNIINVALIPEGASADRDNMNITAVITSELGVLKTSNRYASYNGALAVAIDFGSYSQTYKHAEAFFAQSPNPLQVGGKFIVGYHRANDETTADSPATLKSPQLNSNIIEQIRAITDGSFDITVDGTVANIASLNFSGISVLDDIIDILNTAITTATVTTKNQQIIITSNTAGASSTLTYLTAGTSGTFIGSLLSLVTGSGALLTQGLASVVIPAESKVDALTALKALVNFKGVVFIDNPTDIESKAIATWCQANATMSYDVFSDITNFNSVTTNVVWDITVSNLKNYRMMYSKANNRLLATARMSRQHTVNFSASNTAITINLKELLGVAPEDYSQTEVDNAKKVGLDLYTSIKSVGVIVESGANDFSDNVYNLIAYTDAVQTDTFNSLKNTGKLPQTTEGVATLVSSIEKTTDGFVNAGVFAKGSWSSPTTFGNVDVLKRNIEAKGYYILAQSLADQPQSERAARKSPAIQVAVKNAGAIHSVDIIINFNK